MLCRAFVKLANPMENKICRIYLSAIHEAACGEVNAPQAAFQVRRGASRGVS
jgi:hypothetical protein